MHSTVPPVSPRVKEKAAVVELDGVLTGEVRETEGVVGAVVSSRVVSTVQVDVPLVLVLPAASVWRTETVCDPSARLLSV